MSALPVPALSAFNTQLWLGGPTSPPSYVEQGRMADLKFAGVGVDVVDVTGQTDTAHRLLATLTKIGDMTAMFYWEPSQVQDQALFGYVLSRQLLQWKVIWPDGSSWLFNGYLTKFPPDASIGKALTCTITVSVDGTVTPVYA